MNLFLTIGTLEEAKNAIQRLSFIISEKALDKRGHFIRIGWLLQSFHDFWLTYAHQRKAQSLSSASMASALSRL